MLKKEKKGALGISEVSFLKFTNMQNWKLFLWLKSVISSNTSSLDSVGYEYND